MVNLIPRRSIAPSTQKTWRQEGELIPLFDRLTDEDVLATQEVPVQQHYSPDEMRASILREIYALLETRLPYPKEEYDVAEFYETSVFGLKVGYPFFYGISDFSAYNGGSDQGLKLMEKEIQEAITIFEPRLRNVKVRFERLSDEKQEVVLYLSADMLVGDTVQAFTFPIKLRNGSLEVSTSV